MSSDSSNLLTRIDHRLLHRQATAILSSWKLGAEDVRMIADVMIDTDLRGVDSHGVSMFPMYAQMRAAGQINTEAKPRVVRETASIAVIDADAGFGHAVSLKAMNLAVDKCLEHGCGIVSVFNSHHFGAAGIYAEAAAKRGVIGMVTSATRLVSMVPTFAAEPVLGTNPLAFAAPAAKNPPVLLDMATTSAAGNKIRTYWLNDRTLPEGWAVDGDGKPITDAAKALEAIFQGTGGGLTPLGGTPAGSSHKGYGLALLVHILGGVLSGGSFSPIRKKTQKPSDPDNIGHFFLAIDPRAFRPDGGFETDLDDVVDILHGARRAHPDQPVLVAGDPERAAREERLRQGVPIPRKLIDQLRDIARDSGAEFLLDGR